MLVEAPGALLLRLLLRHSAMTLGALQGPGPCDQSAAQLGETGVGFL